MLPLLAIGVPGSKAARTEDESDDSTLGRVPDELKLMILTAMRQPQSICEMVDAWMRLRKVKEGPMVWTAVLNEMQVPDMFHPVEPTADDVKKLCQNMSSDEGAESLLEETLLKDDVRALQWARRLAGLDMSIRKIFAHAAAKGAMRALEFLLSELMQDGIDVRPFLKKAMRSAVSNGRIEVAQFFLDVLPNDDSFKETLVDIVAKQATKYDNMAFLSWLEERTQYDVPWDLVATYGAMFNNLKVMQLALDNGVTFWDTAVSKAALYGHINAMEFAMNNGGSPRQGFFSASRAGKLDVLKWLLLRYDPSNDELERAIDAAEDFAHKDVMQFLRSKQNA